jgi:hypothetical protein
MRCWRCREEERVEDEEEVEELDSCALKEWMFRNETEERREEREDRRARKEARKHGNN